VLWLLVFGSIVKKRLKVISPVIEKLRQLLPPPYQLFAAPYQFFKILIGSSQFYVKEDVHCGSLIGNGNSGGGGRSKW